MYNLSINMVLLLSLSYSISTFTILDDINIPGRRKIWNSNNSSFIEKTVYFSNI